MTKSEMEFIQSLDLEQLDILNALLKSGIDSDASNYVQFILEHPDSSYNDIELLKTVPIDYMPVLGVNLSKISWCFSTVYDYYSRNADITSKVRSFGDIKKNCLDGACDFVFDYLKKEKGRTNSLYTGKMILDSNMPQKTEIVLGNKIEIYDYLISFGSQYIFSFSKSFDLYTMPKQDRIVEILARYSHLEDLQTHNIESFQKFIKK